MYVYSCIPYLIYYMDACIWTHYMIPYTHTHHRCHCNAEPEMAAGHWPFSNHFQDLAKQNWYARTNLLYISNSEQPCYTMILWEIVEGWIFRLISQ